MIASLPRIVGSDVSEHERLAGVQYRQVKTARARMHLPRERCRVAWSGRRLDLLRLEPSSPSSRGCHRDSGADASGSMLRILDRHTIHDAFLGTRAWW